MIFNKLKLGEITIEVSAIMPEKILNMLWNNEIYTCNIVKIDLTTIRVSIYFKDYKEAEMLIKKYKGKVRIVKNKWYNSFTYENEKESFLGYWNFDIFYSYIYII